MESPKRQRHNKGKDIISKLPDIIIYHILSFLPTKDAVRTCVLSKSWKHHWTFITKLHFEDKECCSSWKKASFLNSVNRVLFHLNSSSIQSFSLSISEDYEPCHVNKWISVVLSRKVKKLCVNSWRQQQTVSPHSLLKFKSLEELVLKVDCCIKVPNFARFSSLTVLKFAGITFSGGTAYNSGKIHLNFPVLRTYKTKDCTWPQSAKLVTLNAPLLEVVSIKENIGHYLEYPYPTIKICASSLTKFTYDGHPFPDSIVFDLSAAHTASADIHIGMYKYGVESLQEVALSSKILKQFENVECLKFRQRWPKEELLAKDSLAVGDLPSFEMLSHLELGEVTGEILLAFLLKTPCLKTLSFEKLVQIDQELMNYDCVPECFSTTLEAVEFGRFDGSEHQLNFAKFVMENGVALKRMTFIPTLELCQSNFEEVKEKLCSFKKCSSFMILEFN